MYIVIVIYIYIYLQRIQLRKLKNYQQYTLYPMCKNIKKGDSMRNSNTISILKCAFDKLVFSRPGVLTKLDGGTDTPTDKSKVVNESYFISNTKYYI